MNYSHIWYLLTVDCDYECTVSSILANNFAEFVECLRSSDNIMLIIANKYVKYENYEDNIFYNELCSRMRKEFQTELIDHADEFPDNILNIKHINRIKKIFNMELKSIDDFDYNNMFENAECASFRIKVYPIDEIINI